MIRPALPRAAAQSAVPRGAALPRDGRVVYSQIDDGLEAHDDRIHIPVWALVGCFLLVAGTIALAAGARLTRQPHPAPPPREAVLLRFTQAPDDALVIRNATTAQPIARIAPTADTFLRATMRILFAARARAGITRDLPFQLALYGPDRLVIADPATHERIDLRAFGPANAKQFATLLRNAETLKPGEPS
ncbi:photosynthetic complex assembly protein PuhC [Acidiphilium sp.]|uniref:photosynthetic complex assembly protein PuhC n=1 Tax=Acidiphilium sp. TaxID=527 RepID=UPI002587C651|nr:photosynthetic complex assembly protein PuhC [Acidiphilium sp.]